MEKPIYGTEVPGAPGTWQRDVWWALYHVRRDQQPPFRYRGLGRDFYVSSGTPKRPYGRSSHTGGRIDHLPRRILFAWERGKVAGRMIEWWCGSKTAYFTTSDRQEKPLCVQCCARVLQAQDQTAEQRS